MSQKGPREAATSQGPKREPSGSQRHVQPPLQGRGPKDSQSFGHDDLPLLVKIADLAHTWIFEQNQA